MSLLGIHFFLLFLDALGVLLQQRVTDPHVLMEYSVLENPSKRPYN